MHGAAHAARLGVRVHSGSGSDAVCGLSGQGTGPRGAGAGAALLRILAQARRGSLPFRRQDTRQVRLGHACALRRLIL